MKIAKKLPGFLATFFILFSGEAISMWHNKLKIIILGRSLTKPTNAMASQNRILTALLAILFIATGYTQSDIVVTAAKGTGQTTGHIATISVKNKGDQPVALMPQVFFIPSHHKFQSYVGQIPDGMRIPAGTVKDIEIPGYCTNVHAPPVPAGKDMPPLSDWVPVAEGAPPSVGSNEQAAIITNPVPRFETSHITNIQRSPGFTGQDNNTGASTLPSWPGTDTPINGTIDADNHPRDFAGLIVSIVESVEDAAERLINQDDIRTPFSGSHRREKEALVQQTVWIVMAELNGDEYRKEDFADNVYEQYESQTGKSSTELAQPQREQIDEGVDDFWGAFQATGVEAKVLINQDGASGEGQNEGEDDGDDDGEEEEPGDCECESLSASFTLEKSGALPYSETISVSGGDFKSTTQEFDEQANFSINKGDVFTASITVESLACSCTTGGECPQIFPDKDAVEDNEDQGDFSMKLLSHSDDLDRGDRAKTQTGASASWELKAKTDSNDTQKLKFEISAYCQAADCQKERCKYKFMVEVNPAAQEEDD